MGGDERRGVIDRYRRLSETARWMLFIPISLIVTGIISLVVGALLINAAQLGSLVAVIETIVSHLTLVGMLYMTIPRGQPVVIRMGTRVVALMVLYFVLCAFMGPHSAWRDSAADFLAAREELATLLLLLLVYRKLRFIEHA